MLWLSLGQTRPETLVSARSANLASALRDWSVEGTAPDRIRVDLDNSPAPRDRDWLAALQRAGSDVSWSGDLPAAGIVVNPVASPRRGFNVLVAAPGAASVKLDDEVGPLDTAASRGGGVSFTIPAANGSIRARVGGTAASASLPDSADIRRLLVLGAAGWESKFVTAALEEDGWTVDAQFRVAPGASVTQGSIGPIDTARYSGVVALDASATPYASDIVRYVSSGGGVVIGGSAATIDALAPLRAGTPGRVVSGSVAAESGSTTLRSLSIVPVAALRADAIALERRDGIVIGAARRHVNGRVVQHGYLDTWRWRMSGGDNSLAEHREWWSRAVSGVAYAPRTVSVSPDTLDNAPFARLVEVLGPASGGSGVDLAAAAGSISLWWLFALLSFCLLAEWASRRLRGSR